MGLLVELKDVVVSYQTSQGSMTVLNNINLNIREREFVSLVGPTGCGKSTILLLLLGSQFPTLGKVNFGGAEIQGIDKQRGVVFQKYGLFPHLKVLDNIAFGPMLSQLNLWDRAFWFISPRWKRVVKRERERAREYITAIGLKPEDCDKYPIELSGGMRQRVSIAQSLMMQPKLLLMDEAFGALDEATREGLQLLLLQEWEKTKMTVVFVTHNVAEALFLGTRVIGLSQHWENDDKSRGQGARIVVDAAAGGQHPKPTEYKYSTEFNALLQKIRVNVLDSSQRTRVSEFNLTHQDAIPA